jgi:hypothetical protein
MNIQKAKNESEINKIEEMKDFLESVYLDIESMTDM